jgi:hypothetical protein
MGSVTSLSLKMNDMMGSIETRIGLLTELNTLDLTGNYLRGDIPEEVWKLQVILETGSSYKSW